MVFIGTGAVVAAKVAGIVTSSYLAWTVYAAMPETQLRRNLLKAFKAGEIGKKVQRGFGKQRREVIIHPTIQRVMASIERKQIVFTVPVGLNPKEIFEHGWLFQQVFGEHIEITGDVKTFALNVYSEGIQAFDYAREEVEKTIKGMALPIFVGRSRSGPVAYDMADNPHLLIAGETGSGKSVELRAILSTLILFAGDRMELYGGDLKRSEFHLFRGIAKEIANDSNTLYHRILKPVKNELKKRGSLLDREGLANIIDLPESIRPKFIVVAIDEVALLQKNADCMDIIEEISAIGRALGVFLILSMQRPDKDVLDGKLKNNLTVRMAFRHADEINSRITIGSGEAALIKQSEKGLMIHKLDGVRYVQAPHLRLDAARKLLEPYKSEAPAEPETVAQDPEGDDLELEVLPF
ncbi:cell division protein FtsK [Paenibacillus sp. N4]|uniref:FtsK/SpoIIIE domain-containing protein n=1 Tax=Paenibacillus vietnamensis TaxID=2590547 RepID=UPI001CD061CB|nr:FtsK/SpoIIIE domain-containing protein [Paenibacillus vietnamensis]MCA0754885.1 cell division protein FtsK [Paenibacillus vietnamensis]